MNFKIKKGWLILGVILLLFILTNPSIKGFKDFRGQSSYQGLKRQKNFLVCSVYNDDGNEYFGILSNFFSLRKPPEPIYFEREDSIKKADNIHQAWVKDSLRQLENEELPILTPTK